MKRQVKIAEQISPLAKYVRPGLNIHEVQQIKKVFDLFDTNQNGLINPKDLKAALIEQGKKALETPLYQLICDQDQEGKGWIDFEGFLFFFTYTITGNEDEAEMLKIFNLFDDEKTGYISILGLRRICKYLHLHIDEQDIQQMIKQADLDQDGFISFDQFSQIIKHKSTA